MAPSHRRQPHQSHLWRDPAQRNPAPVVVASILVARAILLEAGLSFLGLGDPNLISWGSLLSEAQERIGASVWLALFPGMALSLLVLCVNLFGDGINDVLNPKLGKR